MTTLIRDPNTGGFALPSTLVQGSNFTDPAGRTGVVNYDSLTGAKLAPGGTTLSRPMGSVPFTLPSGPSASPSRVSFTTALLQLLKDAQNRNTTGQASLMKQSQGINGLGLNDARMNFRNKNLAPNSGTSLGMSAQNEFDPLQLSIENQQKLASQNLGNITDLVKQTSSDYQDEQDRIARAKEKSSNMTFDTQANISHQVSAFERIKGAPYTDDTGKVVTTHDNYVAPEAWTAALNNWMINGGTYASFVSNFKRYLNPASYELVGIGTETGA